MNSCKNLYFLSTLACQLAECLDEKELETLSADLTALGYMLESILAHRPECTEESTTPSFTNKASNPSTPW